MTTKRPIAGVAAMAGAFAGWSSALAQATFQVLTIPAGFPSLSANGLSSDAAAVVGTLIAPNPLPGQFGPDRAFRWTSAGGMQVLDVLPGDYRGRAAVVSADGSVVIGDSIGNGTVHTFRWTAATGVQPLDTQGLSPWVGSADASVLGGQMAGYAPARWTAPGGLLQLASSGVVQGMSADGATIVGDTSQQLGSFVWTAANGIVSMGPGTPEYPAVYAEGIAPDASVVVGYLQRGSAFFETEPFVWTADTGFRVLTSPTGTAGAASGASRHGTIVVGGIQSQAAFWTYDGYHEVRATLIAAGVQNLAGWHLGNCRRVSDDGRTIVGQGTDPASQPQTWVATLPVLFGCYANCDSSTASPVLNINDFICFLNRYAAGDSYANCDGSTTTPVLNVLDFTCFLNKFAAGCP